MSDLEVYNKIKAAWSDLIEALYEENPIVHATAVYKVVDELKAIAESLLPQENEL